ENSLRPAMKTTRINGQRRTRAEGILEVLIVTATLALLIVVAVPMLSRPTVRGRRIQCVNNLKQVGLAARLWSNDHSEVFPWDASVESNGIKEISFSGDLAALYSSL